MCLDAVTETYDHPSTLIVDGWKEFGGSTKQPTFQNYTYKGSNVVPLDTWIPASNEHSAQIKANDGKKYEPGFHTYFDETEFKGMGRSNSNSYRRVFLRKVSCLGRQSSLKTVIALEMYVPSDQNGWPPKKSRDDDDPITPITPSDPSAKKRTPRKSIMERFRGITPGNA
jgi:hypothetical protein